MAHEDLSARAVANNNETLYVVRHAEAHPQGYWSDNNYVGAGQWRALNLPNALLDKVMPDQVWSTRPGQHRQMRCLLEGLKKCAASVASETVTS